MIKQLLEKFDADPRAWFLIEALIQSTAAAIYAAQTVELIGSNSRDMTQAEYETKLRFAADVFANKLLESANDFK